VAVGGGGYEIVDVVPRAWAHLVGEAVGRPVDVDEPVPEVWRERVRAMLGRPAPRVMGEGRSTDYRPWADGWDPLDPVDRAILATRRAVFPLHGLHPDLDV
jgi:acetoin utilization protein AcuC